MKKELIEEFFTKNRRTYSFRIKDGLPHQARELGLDVNAIVEKSLEEAITRVSNLKTQTKTKQNQK